MPQLRMQLEGVDKLEARLTKTMQGFKDTHLLFRRWVIILYASVKQNFAAGGRPTPWPPPKVRKGQPLRDTGRLMASVTGSGNYQEEHSATRHALTIGSNVVYANVHQEGIDKQVTIKSHSRTQTKAFGRAIAPRRVQVRAHSRQMRIPPRPFLLMQEADKAALLEEARKFYFGE
jgi:phage gpG-like protein